MIFNKKTRLICFSLSGSAVQTEQCAARAISLTVIKQISTIDRLPQGQNI